MYKISCTLHVFFKQIFLKKIASKNLSVVSTSFAEKTPGQNWGAHTLLGMGMLSRSRSKEDLGNN